MVLEDYASKEESEVKNIKPLMIAMAAITPAVSFGAPPHYRLKDLGAIPEDFISYTGKGIDLNSKGHIAGASLGDICTPAT